MSFSSRAVATTVLAGLLAVAAWLGLEVLVVVAACAVVLLAQGGPAVTAQPRQGGTPLVVAAAGLLSLLVAWHSPALTLFQFLPLVLGISIGMAFLAEMMRQDGRARLVSSLSAAVTGALIGTGLAGWIAAARYDVGAHVSGFRPALVIVAALTVVMAAAVNALRVRPGWIGFVVLLWVVAAVGALLGLAIPAVGWDIGLIIGASIGLITGVLKMLFGDEAHLSDPRAALSAAVVPVAVSGLLLLALRWVLVR